MAAKNHDRSPDKKGFSVALPRDILADVERIARQEHRSRNGQIEHFLAESVKRWEIENIPAKNASKLKSLDAPTIKKNGTGGN